MLVERSPERLGQRWGMASQESLSDKLEKCGGTPKAEVGKDTSLLIDQMLEQARISAMSTQLDDVPAESQDEEAESVGSLHHAASFGEVELVDEIIKAGVDVEQRCKDGSTSLHVAASEGRADVVALLLDRGAGVHSLDKFGSTALHLAAVKGHRDAVHRLLEGGGSPGSRVWGDEGLGETPLHRAACIGDLGVTRLLVESPRAAKQRVDLVMMRDEDGETPLHSAARWGHTDVVSLLVGAGGDVNTLADDQNAPLHWAAKEGHAECIRRLLECGANCEVRNEDGDTPLLLASAKGHVEACRILLDAMHGHPERGSHLSWSLEAAVKMDHPKACALLLSAGASPDSRTDEGIPVLHVACREGHRQVVDRLLEANAIVGAASAYDGSTPLHMAAQEDHGDLVERLVQGGALVDQVQEDGSTPLHTAAASASLAAVGALLRHGADVRATNHHLWTPLHSAAMVGSLEAVQVLLAAGADHRAVNSMGEVAANLAERGSYWEVVSALQMREALDDLGIEGQESAMAEFPDRPAGPPGMGAEDPWEMMAQAREARETLKRRISRLSNTSSGSARYHPRMSGGEGMDCVTELAELMSEVMSEDVTPHATDKGAVAINILAPGGVAYFSPVLQAGEAGPSSGPSSPAGAARAGAGAEGVGGSSGGSPSQPGPGAAGPSAAGVFTAGASTLGAPAPPAMVGNRKPRWISGQTSTQRRRRAGRRDTWAPTLPKPTSVTPGGSRAAHRNGLERARRERLGGEGSGGDSPVHTGVRKRGSQVGMQAPPKPDLLDDLWAQQWVAGGEGEGINYPPPDGFGFGSDSGEEEGDPDVSPSQSKRSRESNDDLDDVTRPLRSHSLSEWDGMRGGGEGGMP